MNLALVIFSMLAISCHCAPVIPESSNAASDNSLNKGHKLSRLRHLRQQHAKILQSSRRECALPPEQRPAITAFLGVSFGHVMADLHMIHCCIFSMMQPILQAVCCPNAWVATQIRLGFKLLFRCSHDRTGAGIWLAAFAPFVF